MFGAFEGDNDDDELLVGGSDWMTGRRPKPFSHQQRRLCGGAASSLSQQQQRHSLLSNTSNHPMEDVTPRHLYRQQQSGGKAPASLPCAGSDTSDTVASDLMVMTGNTSFTAQGSQNNSRSNRIALGNDGTVVVDIDDDDGSGDGLDDEVLGFSMQPTRHQSTRASLNNHANRSKQPQKRQPACLPKSCEEHAPEQDDDDDDEGEFDSFDNFDEVDEETMKVMSPFKRRVARRPSVKPNSSTAPNGAPGSTSTNVAVVLHNPKALLANDAGEDEDENAPVLQRGAINLNKVAMERDRRQSKQQQPSGPVSEYMEDEEDEEAGVIVVGSGVARSTHKVEPVLFTPSPHAPAGRKPSSGRNAGGGHTTEEIIVVDEEDEEEDASSYHPEQRGTNNSNSGNKAVHLASATADW